MMRKSPSSRFQLRESAPRPWYIAGKNNFDLNNNLYQHYLLGYVFILVIDLRMCKQCSIIIGIHVYVCVRAYVRVHVYM